MIGITNKIIGVEIIFILHCTFISFVISQTRIVVSDNACFDSVYRTNSTIFSAPYAGEVEAVELEYRSGGMTCLNGTVGRTNWGCLFPSDKAFGIQVTLQKTSDGNAWGSLEYPKSSDISSFGLLDDYNCNGAVCPYWSWESASYNQTSPNIVMHGSMTVATTDTYSLQICEAVCLFVHGDNDGITCAKVTFVYSKVITENPTLAPSHPTLAPTSPPTRTPSSNPSSNPSLSPTLSPSHAPTLTPSHAPTDAPISSPSSSPTHSPTIETEKDPEPEFENLQMIIFGGAVIVLLCLGCVAIIICYSKLSRKQVIDHQVPQVRVINNPGAGSFRQNSFVVQKQVANDHRVSMQYY